ncbi:MAG: hypothetical protein K6B43_05465 [Treponema sp.]|nr:hypothetical protein [Treponema sp.]
MIDFFWTVSIKRYVFIDCENAENSNAEKVCDFLNEKKYISPDTQIFCFIGGDNELVFQILTRPSGASVFRFEGFAAESVSGSVAER